MLAGPPMRTTKHASLATTIAALTLVAAPRPARAQTIETGLSPAPSRETARRYGGAGFFAFGALLTDQDPMNDALAARGLPQVSSAFVTLGSAGYFRLNRLLLGGEGYAILPREGSSPTHETTVSGGMGFFDVGYVVVSRGGLAIFPMLGLGGGGLSYSIGEKRAGGFDAVLDDPRRGASLTRGGFLGQIALGIDHLFDGRREATQAGGPVVGLRVGYAAQLTHGDWQVFGASVDGGPSVGLGGPFLRLVVGGGGMELD